MIIHPGFNAETGSNDIAALELEAETGIPRLRNAGYIIHIKYQKDLSS